MSHNCTEQSDWHVTLDIIGISVGWKLSSLCKTVRVPNARGASGARGEFCNFYCVYFKNKSIIYCL